MAFIQEQKKIFNHLLGKLRKASFNESSGQLTVKIGKLFLGKNYGFHPYDNEFNGSLHINLKKFDCFSFLEHVVAFVLLLKSKQDSFESFERILKTIGYRSGSLTGFISRLHYFTDWVYENEKRGFIKDVTKEIGGKRFRKRVDFMSKNKKIYPPLMNLKNLSKIKEIENKITKRLMYFISKKNLRASEDWIEDGDLIGITTKKRGLDVEHVGIAIRIGSRIHLLHASRKAGKVLVSKETLFRYLMRSKTRTGIMVARLF